MGLPARVPRLDRDRETAFRRARRELKQLIETLLQDGVEKGAFVIADVQSTLLAFLGVHNYTYQWAHDGVVSIAKQLSQHYGDVLLKDQPLAQALSAKARHPRPMRIPASRRMVSPFR